MDRYQPFIIKSFKHDGSLHRAWLENWRIPSDRFAGEWEELRHWYVIINDQTPVIEASGTTWTSRIPGVSFFVPGAWYNIVALIDSDGVRYYCNIASPPMVTKQRVKANEPSKQQVLTYIDYDLDVIVRADGSMEMIDQDEYESHKKKYRYSQLVQQKVQTGLKQLLERIQLRKPPFDAERIVLYYNEWKMSAMR